MVSTTEGGAAAGTQPKGRTDSRPARNRSRLRRVFVAAIGMLLAALLMVGGGTWFAVQRIAGDIERIPGVFDPAQLPPEHRPVKPAPGEPGAGAVTFLLAGLDRRSAVPTTGTQAQAPIWEPDAARTDAIMILHITDDREAAYIVSIPRDTWVPVPGHGRDKINNAFSYGGPPLYVRTVEQLTDLRIDHLAVIDWAGIKRLTDAVGGVTLTFDAPSKGKPLDLPAGTHTLDGKQALSYLRERQSLPAGDLDRVDRHQHFLRELMRQLLSRDVLTRPGSLFEVIGAITSTTSIDAEMGNTELARLALSLRDIRVDDVTFMTVPTDGVSTVGDASIVVYDKPAADRAWDAVRNDSLESYAAAHPELILSSSVP